MAVAGVRLFPVISTSASSRADGGAISFFGIKTPIGVLVVSAAGVIYLAVSGKDLPLDELINKVPGIRAILERDGTSD